VRGSIDSALNALPVVGPNKNTQQRLYAAVTSFQTDPADEVPMNDDRRATERTDRRARARSGRRNGEPSKPWYYKRRLWLAALSLVYVGWRRIVRRTPT
jgi:hypothetical protein